MSIQTNIVPAVPGTVVYTVWVDMDGDHGYEKHPVLAWSITTTLGKHEEEDEESVWDIKSIPVTPGCNLFSPVWGCFIPGEEYRVHYGEAYETEKEMLFELYELELRDKNYLSADERNEVRAKLKAKLAGGAV